MQTHIDQPDSISHALNGDHPPKRALSRFLHVDHVDKVIAQVGEDLRISLHSSSYVSVDDLHPWLYSFVLGRFDR